MKVVKYANYGGFYVPDEVSEKIHCETHDDTTEIRTNPNIGVRRQRVIDLLKEIHGSDLVASEVLRYLIHNVDRYKDTSDEEIAEILEITGDDEYVGG